MERVRSYYPPEFLNRIDEIVIFNKLNRKDMDRIVSIQLEKITARLLDERKIELVVEPEAVHWIAALSYDPTYGARPLRRVLQRNLLGPIATGLLNGSIIDDSVVRLSIGSDGALSIETLTTAKEAA
jgi:ATP-dependent Clp protease ATP-binding subunit ClpB